MELSRQFGRRVLQAGVLADKPSLGISEHLGDGFRTIASTSRLEQRLRSICLCLWTMGDPGMFTFTLTSLLQGRCIYLLIRLQF